MLICISSFVLFIATNANEPFHQVQVIVENATDEPVYVNILITDKNKNIDGAFDYLIRDNGNINKIEKIESMNNFIHQESFYKTIPNEAIIMVIIYKNSVVENYSTDNIYKNRMYEDVKIVPLLEYLSKKQNIIIY